jgi:hypothetical protein
LRHADLTDCLLLLAAPVSTQFWYHDPLSPIQLGSSLHAFGAASAFMVVVCIWVRVAAKLHDPAGSTKKALYQLAFAIDGSGIGRYIKPIICLSLDAVGLDSLCPLCDWRLIFLVS